MSNDIDVKRRWVMDGLCRIINADAWAWTKLDLASEERPRQILIDHGGFDEGRLAAWASAIEHPRMEPYTERVVSEAVSTNRGITRNSVDFVPDSYWCRDGNPALTLWTEADIGGFMLSSWPLPGVGYSGIGLYRAMAKEQFTARECRIAHIIFSEVSWLHETLDQRVNADILTSLYPRHRTVFNLLCDGWSRKSISEHLGISIHTVHGYAKDVFRHFRVHSQSELIARMTKGDGGDRRESSGYADAQRELECHE